MATTVEMVAFERFALIRQWEDLTHEEKTAFFNIATQAAESVSIDDERDHVHDLMRIVMFDDDISELHEDWEMHVPITDAQRVLFEVAADDSDVDGLLKNIEVIAPSEVG